MKRSVCIITWYGTPNYGSNFQSLGLAHFLSKLGYNVFFLDKFKVHSFLFRHPVLLFARAFNKINTRKSKQFFTPVPYSISAHRQERLKRFKQEHYKTKSYYQASEWKKDIDEHIIFACGSDILWNPARGYPTINFLDVAYYAKLPRFSYGSSIGERSLPKRYYRAYKRYLGSMAEVGVREQASADLLEPIIGRKVTKVIDPSLLLTPSDWDSYAEKAELSVEIKDGHFILCYFVMNDSQYWDYVKKVREATGLQIIVLPMHQLDELQPYDIVMDGTFPEFIWLMKNADFICTDSFHACAASLIYEKEFYLLRRTRRSEDAKFDEFLGRYHLTDRSITDASEFTRKEVDYRFAREQLEQDRRNSADFLIAAMEKCK